LADVADGAFIFLGIANTTLQTDQKLHTPRFKVDDSMMPVGAALHASVAMQYLEDHHLQQAQSPENITVEHEEL